MSCRSFRREWQPGGADAHASSCSPCREWLATRRELASGLARLSTHIAAAEPPARELELRAAFRGRHGAAPRRPELRWFLGGAVAAGLLAVVATRPHAPAPAPRAEGPAAAPALAPPAKPRPSSEPKRPARRMASRPAPPVASEAAPLPVESPVTEAAAAVVAPPPPPEPASEPSEPVVRAADGTEASSPRAAREQSFYPLLPDREPSALESGQIVRVQVRPEVLSAAGLSSRTSGTAPVEAEVLMGPDGVALGIRLPRPKR